jgi:hypothetical protein
MHADDNLRPGDDGNEALELQNSRSGYKTRMRFFGSCSLDFPQVNSSDQYYLNPGWVSNFFRISFHFGFWCLAELYGRQDAKISAGQNIDTAKIVCYS